MTSERRQRCRVALVGNDRVPQPEVGSRSRILLTIGLMLWLLMGGMLLLVIERPRAGPNDATAHAVIFGGVTLAALALAHCGGAGPRTIRKLVVVLLTLAPASELVQFLVADGRSASAGDVAANLAGMAVATALFLLVRRCSHVITWSAVSGGLLVFGSVIVVFIGANLVRESLWWRCGAHDASSMMRSLIDWSEGPIAEFDGSVGRWRTAEDEWLVGAGMPRATSTDLWCAAIRREALSVVAVVRADRLPSDRTVEIFGSSSRLSGEEANIELDASGDGLITRVRTRVRPPLVSTLYRREVFEPPGLRWIAFRYADGLASMDTDDRSLLAQEVRISFDAWNPRFPILVDDELRSGVASGAVRYVGYFARSLSDDELRGATDVLVELD